MFDQVKRKSMFQSALGMAELTYHSIVRNIRKGHNNAIWALVSNMMQAAIFILAFYMMFMLIGIKRANIRGDFLLYIISGIFLFMVHIKTIGAITGSDGPSSAMMQHAPMNTIISIAAAAIGTLYIQVLTLFVILFVYHVAITPFEIEDPAGAFAMLLIAWLAGVAIGLVLLSMKPWFPGLVAIFTTVFQRVNMIASGKMFVANTLPAFMLPMFEWNPLFHLIDQARGFMFVNYVPRNTSIEYPVIVAASLLVIGMMAEFYTRQHASSSWNARR
ncbi:ABC transporter, permease protein [hydrothermal vent metagenome]|uniref:ABC transporter, permease protein n=1 Tax=hydrothermal vent metagenome TaxID=652676 RepID=A0A3B0RFJ8_9ZZZZ